ncbi:MAG: hypothetical protein ACXW2E_00350 [Nitrososphaeraceae archaeon]
MINTTKKTKNGLIDLKEKNPPTPESTGMTIEEIQNLDEPIFVAPPKPTRKRPSVEKYLSYEDAKEFVRGEMIPSRKKYHEWWDRHKPKAVPKFPYRTYREWTSWNDFLGTSNHFGIKAARSWRNMEEAALWVHRLRLENYVSWMAYCKINKLPVDIPTRPDLVYKKWKSWNHWLGNKPVEALQAVRDAQKLHIYFIVHEKGVPENVFTFGVDTIGPSNFKERWQHEKFDIIKLFWYDAEKVTTIDHIVTTFSTPYLANDKQRICPNVWEILWYLSMNLDLITKL